VIRLGLVYFGIVVSIAAVITGAPWLMTRVGSDRPAEAVTAPAEAPAVPAAPAPVLAAAPDPAPAPVPAPVAEAEVAVAAPAPTAEPAPANGAAAALAAAAAAVVKPAAEPAPVAEVARAQPVVRGGKASLDQTTAAILAELAIVTEQGDTADGGMLEMSSLALTGLKSVQGKGADKVETLESLVASALRDGKPDAEIDVLVNDAAGDGRVSVPAMLVTSEGKVDTAVLLANLVTQAQIATGAAQPVAPEDVIAGGEGVEVHLVTKAGGAAEMAQFYTVGAGDSLGAIAVRFYGDVSYYPRIFDANRTILSSPDRLMVGQRLVIPRFSDL
jgi:nucleoid-associated protein YgaU